MLMLADNVIVTGLLQRLCSVYVDHGVILVLMLLLPTGRGGGCLQGPSQAGTRSAEAGGRPERLQAPAR